MSAAGALRRSGRCSPFFPEFFAPRIALGSIKESGGCVDKLDVWGKRRMSFEIQKKSEGIYAVVDMHCEPAAIKELDRQLNLNEAVLRTKVMRPE